MYGVWQRQNLAEAETHREQCAVCIVHQECQNNCCSLSAYFLLYLSLSLTLSMRMSIQCMCACKKTEQFISVAIIPFQESFICTYNLWLFIFDFINCFRALSSHGLCFKEEEKSANKCACGAFCDRVFKHILYTHSVTLSVCLLQFKKNKITLASQLDQT